MFEFEKLQIENDLENYVEDLGKDFGFEMHDSHKAIFSVYDVDLMEDEDDFKDDVISTFQEYGITPKAEWDYDAGNMCDRWCNLVLTF